MRNVLAAGAAALLLAACSSDQSALAPPCPEIVVVKELGEVTQFRPGEGRDLTDVVLEASVGGFDGFCETEIDDGKPVEVEVEMRLLFDVSRGPANTDRKGAFRYFIAINDAADRTVQKHVFDTDVEFPGNRNRVAPFDELSLTVPLKAGENGGDYTVYVGFQLTDEQLEYNRAQQLR